MGDGVAGSAHAMQIDAAESPRGRFSPKRPGTSRQQQGNARPMAGSVTLKS